MIRRISLFPSSLVSNSDVSAIFPVFSDKVPRRSNLSFSNSPDRSTSMPKSIFDREIFLKMEQVSNPFVAARALSLRAREVNARQAEGEPSVSAPAVALEDYLEGRILFTENREESFDED